MLLRFGYDITLSCPHETPMIALLAVHPDRRGDLQDEEQVILTPEVPNTVYRDLYGNLCRRFTAPVGDMRIWGDGTIADDGLIDPADYAAEEIPVAELPDDCLGYLLGSRYCETDRMSQIAWDRFGQLSPGWNRVQAVCNFVHDHIKFDYMEARDTRTAYEAYQEGKGVCRDFTHLAVTLCRCLNVPTRYVNGHLGDIGVPIQDPMDFSAWMEVYLRDGQGQGRWFTFDPRNNMPRLGRIVIARGRDAADVPLVHSFGQHTLKDFRVWTYEVEKDGSEIRERAQMEQEG
ncbi:MAG: transglutaminase family protein [Rhodovibrionaceae bacterium]